jgi:hypothetical protein
MSGLGEALLDILSPDITVRKASSERGVTLPGPPESIICSKHLKGLRMGSGTDLVFIQLPSVSHRSQTFLAPWVTASQAGSHMTYGWETFYRLTVMWTLSIAMHLLDPPQAQKPTVSLSNAVPLFQDASANQELPVQLLPPTTCPRQSLPISLNG